MTATTSAALLAASVQRSIGLVLAWIVIVGFIVYLIVNIRRAKPEVGAETELAPNRTEYFDDETLEGPRLDRFLTWALVLLAISAVGLPLYWLAEPGRQQGATERYEVVFASRGRTLFEANCAGCHSAGATGGVAPYVLQDREGDFLDNVAWRAPALDNALLRFDREEIQYVLDHGRPFSPMQPWSTVGGGAMNEQQTKNLIDYLQSVTITPEEAQNQVRDGLMARITEELAVGVEDQAARSAIAEEVQAAFEASATDAEALIELGVVSSEAEATVKLGQLMFNNEAAAGSYSCARCHTRGWSFSRPDATGGGAFGPRLWDVVSKFNNPEQLTTFLGQGCEEGKVYGRQSQCKSGQMPAFASMYTPEQLEAVGLYLATLDGSQRYVFDPQTPEEAQAQ
ncbi:MAG: c-type cytochrome [Acidimicrobiales bacterium]